MAKEFTSEFPHTSKLNSEQLMAHNIVTNHLHALVAGRKSKQLLMMVMGHGGMGKSMMLNTIMETFGMTGNSDLLKKTALSGLMASLIGGTTLHWFAGLPAQKVAQSDIWPDNSSKTVKDRRAQNLWLTQYLAIDEAGMCTLDLLTLSQVAGKARSKAGPSNSTEPFGRMNIVLIGDSYQFPPVGNMNATLYCVPHNRNTVIIGKAIYAQFETDVKVKKQWRMDNTIWINLLETLREAS